VSQSEPRLKEAAKLGFTRALVPAGRGKAKRGAGLSTIEIAHLKDLVALIADDGPLRPAAPLRQAH
jgi:DNA repair protein RadA/Sms